MGSVTGQTEKIDSLKKELHNHTVKDTTRVDLLNELANYYLEKDSIAMMIYLKEAQIIAKTIKYDKGLARVLFLNGCKQLSNEDYSRAIELLNQASMLYSNLGFQEALAECFVKMGLASYNQFNYKKSIDYFKNSVEIYNNISQRRETIFSLKFIGYCFTDMGNYEEAEKYLKDAHYLSIKFNDSIELANSTNVLGILNLHKGNYPLALENYNRALDIYEKINDEEGVAIVLNNKGIIYKNYKDYDSALENYKQALKIQEKLENNKDYAIGLNNIGVVYKQKKDFENALFYLEEALKLSNSLNDKDNIARCLINLGDVYLGLQNNELALQSFLEAKKINTDIGAQQGLCYSLLGISRVYEKEKKYDLALVNALESSKISEEIGLLDYYRDVNELLSKIFEKTKNYKKALESHQQFKILNDSLFNKENIEKIAQLEYEYKYKQALDSANIRELKLNKTILSTSQDLAKTKQNYLWAVIGILGTSILSGSFVFYQKYKSVKIRNQNIVTEQKLLRSQMTPHFIFNSLSVLQGMILNKEEQKSITYLSKFSKLLRIVLENSRDKVVPLIQELDAIDNYMMLQNLDADPPYDYSLIVDENIDINQFLVPPMLIQPFIENAIEHAFTTDQEHREIGVHLTFEHKKLRCTITDNGIGIDAISNKTDTKKKSLATTITKERLEMLAKDFKTAGGITIADRKKDKERGTRVTLLVPYKPNENT